MQRVHVWSLFKELKSHVPWGLGQKMKETEKPLGTQPCSFMFIFYVPSLRWRQSWELSCCDKLAASKAWSIYCLVLYKKIFADLWSLTFKTFFLCLCVNICVCVVFRQCSPFVCFLNLLFWDNIMLTSNYCWVPFLFLFHWIKIWEPLLSVLCLYYVSPLGVTWEY